MNEWSDGMESYTGKPRLKAVYTITIAELMETGVFDWSRPELDWSSAAFDQNQYERVCEYFTTRFYYREISMTPFKQWAMKFKQKMVFELMPKYKPLYERLKEGYAPLSDSDEFYKSREVDSSYPQTMLSGNSDYLTNGRDEENERIREGNLTDMMNKYGNEFRTIDEMLLDELESMFVCMYTTNINGW